MKTISRQHFTAKLVSQNEDKLSCALNLLNKRISSRISEQAIATCGLFQDDDMLYLYFEKIIRQANNEPLVDHNIWKNGSAIFPQHLFPELTPLLVANTGEKWQQMELVYYFAQPEDLEDWHRKIAPTKQCGRLAILQENQIDSYKKHHQAISEEGRMKGDKFQSIALLGNRLFSYYEEPRDNEIVNVKRSKENESLALKEWLTADPEDHFIHGTKNPIDNFYPIKTLFSSSTLF